MKTLVLLFACLAATLAAAAQVRAQEADAPEGAVVRSADVSGFNIERLSPGLRQEIRALTGTPLKKDALAALARRIEDEQPDVVTAIRSVATADGGARVIFLVGRIGDDKDLEANINARYTIESVAIEGVPEARVSQALRDDIQKLVGGRIDEELIAPLVKRLRDDLQGYDISRRISRGSQRGQVRLVFDVREGESLRWLHFAPSASKIIYHADLGWSGVLDVPFTGREHRVTLNLAFGNDDDLIEEYSGYGLRIESRRLGTERLGFSLDLSRYHQSWEPATLAALAANPSVPEPYRVRSTVAPAMAVAITPHLRVTGGVSITELESLMQSPDSQMANAATAAIGYSQRWKDGSHASHDAAAHIGLRAGTDALQSDLAYRRYFADVSYGYHNGSSLLTAAAAAGRISGEAPLFERFSLGDSSTLRGWNRFDVAPAGGNRMLHGSLEYSLDGFAIFVDGGSVWNHGSPTAADDHAHLRTSSGFGYHRDNVFLLLAFPINTDDVRTVFMAGVRF